MYAFEQGIRLRANINDSSGQESTYVVHALDNQEPQYIEVNENETAFTVNNVFLNEKDKIHLSKINKKDELEPAKLYLQAFPSTIPSLDVTNEILKPKSPYGIFASLKNVQISFENINKVQQLEEVVVKTVLERTMIRARMLSEGRQGRVQVVDENDRIQFQTLANFLNFRSRMRASDVNGRLIVNQLGAGRPTIYLDDMLVLDTSLLYLFPLNNVDYIESARVNVGGTINGNSGYLKIYTDYTNRGSKANAQSTQYYSLPLTFSTKKKYYTPKYRYYNDDFYKGYGIVDWKPVLTADNNGNISIKILQPEVPITLFIEGIANDDSFIFEEKTISLN